ncbi:hypothetical protein DMQ72_03630 [Klebsiella quasipneumoniae]|nr:hypothetical protein [Klebsiella quasipneumoniae]MBZ7053872.1 hypothetical protein [Klebsiella quasipneumoniae]PXI00785.1 hypothetical protein DMQ72_03630 [Klebsiella quasipneumoniae]
MTAPDDVHVAVPAKWCRRPGVAGCWIINSAGSPALISLNSRSALKPLLTSLIEFYRACNLKIVFSGA